MTSAACAVFLCGGDGQWLKACRMSSSRPRMSRSNSELSSPSSTRSELSLRTTRRLLPLYTTENSKNSLTKTDSESIKDKNTSHKSMPQDSVKLQYLTHVLLR